MIAASSALGSYLKENKRTFQIIEVNGNKVQYIFDDDGDIVGTKILGAADTNKAKTLTPDEVLKYATLYDLDPAKIPPNSTQLDLLGLYLKKYTPVDQSEQDLRDNVENIKAQTDDAGSLLSYDDAKAELMKIPSIKNMSRAIEVLDEAYGKKPKYKNTIGWLAPVVDVAFGDQTFKIGTPTPLTEKEKLQAAGLK